MAKSWETLIKEEIDVVMEDYKETHKLKQKDIKEIKSEIVETMWDAINEYIRESIDNYIVNNDIEEKE